MRHCAFYSTSTRSRISPQVALEALGLGFFSIGVGLGLMITYAAYSGADVSLKEIAVVSVLADTAISLLAGLAVFPIVFAYGLDPASGAGLVFVTLPLAFAQMPFGTLAAFGFFVLLFVAALASAISMLELVVALLMQAVRHAARCWPARSRAAFASSPGSPRFFRSICGQTGIRWGAWQGSRVPPCSTCWTI